MGLGSGVMLPSGDIITNFHVVKGGARYTVGRGKQASPATLKGGDPDKDLCLLAAPGLVAEVDPQAPTLATMGSCPDCGGTVEPKLELGNEN